jgi:hypothetical protein
MVFLVDMGEGNGERSPSIEQLFGIDMVGVMGSTLHPQYFHLLKHLNDGEYSPSIMFSSLPSICNDGEHSLSFLSSFPFEAFAMIESTPYLKILISLCQQLKRQGELLPHGSELIGNSAFN